MGQYFKLMNLDEKEYVAPPSLMKDAERVSHHVNGAMQVYLTVDGPDDGTYLPWQGKYVGRWAGDDVRWIGDYHEDEIYQETYPTLTIETPSGEIVTKSDLPAVLPVEKEDIEDRGSVVRNPSMDKLEELNTTAGNHYKRLDSAAETGDIVYTSGMIDDEYFNGFGIVVEREESEWENITDGIIKSMKSADVWQHVEPDRR